MMRIKEFWMYQTAFTNEDARHGIYQFLDRHGDGKGGLVCEDKLWTHFLLQYGEHIADVEYFDDED